MMKYLRLSKLIKENCFRHVLNSVIWIETLVTTDMITHPLLSKICFFTSGKFKCYSFGK
jgi:hypothetical protein